MNFGKWKIRFMQDFKKKEFLPIKGLFFLIFGANVSLVPFLTLQARSLGISEEEVGIIYSFIPIASLIAPALSGMLADRIGNFRVLLSLVTAMAGLTGLLFLVVPPGRVVHTLPDTLPVEITCTQGFGNQIKVADPYQCEPALSYDSFVVDLDHCWNTCYPVEDFQDFLIDIVKYQNLQCQNSTNCLEKPGIYRDVLLNGTTENGTSLVYDTFNGNNSLVLTENYNIHITTDRINGSFQDVSYESSTFVCPNLNMTRQDPRKRCYTTCRAKTTRDHMCLNKFSIQELNPSLTFYSHLVIRLLMEFTLSTSMPLLEGAAVTILKEHTGDFGFQRLFCNIGMMVMTPISGTLIDYFSITDGTQDYRPAMYMYCGLKLTAAVIILFLNLEFKKASTKIISDLSSMMLNPEIICFLTATFLAGTCYGYIETFLFWLLEDLGADKQLMGLTLTVGSIFGIPLLMVSTFILKKLGHINTIVLGFSVYIIRLFGYTLISSPWWAMPFEALECVTVSLMVVSFVSYAAVLASPSTVVTLQGMYGGLYNGVGRGAGSLIGGYLIENIGIFQTFRIMAAIGGVSGATYMVINLCFFRNKNQTPVVNLDNNEIVKTALGNQLPDATILDAVKLEEVEIKDEAKSKDIINDEDGKIIVPGIVNTGFAGDTPPV